MAICKTGLGEDIIKMDLKNNIGGYGLDHLAQDRDKWHILIYMVVNLHIL